MVKSEVTPHFKDIISVYLYLSINNLFPEMNNELPIS